jgi:hypothetical protein
MSKRNYNHGFSVKEGFGDDNNHVLMHEVDGIQLSAFVSDAPGTTYDLDELRLLDEEIEAVSETGRALSARWILVDLTFFPLDPTNKNYLYRKSADTVGAMSYMLATMAQIYPVAQKVYVTCKADPTWVTATYYGGDLRRAWVNVWGGT